MQRYIVHAQRNRSFLIAAPGCTKAQRGGSRVNRVCRHYLTQRMEPKSYYILFLYNNPTKRLPDLFALCLLQYPKAILHPSLGNTRAPTRGCLGRRFAAHNAAEPGHRTWHKQSVNRVANFMGLKNTLLAS